MWNIAPKNTPNEAYVWLTDVFTNDEIDLIIDIGKSLPLEDGRVNNTGISALDSRRSKISWITPTVNTEFIFQRIANAIHQVNNDFFKYDLTEMEDLQFTEYDSSYLGMYQNHTDDGFEACDRKLSFSLQLSDPTDYEGGDLLVYRFKLNHPASVHKQKGFLAVFPSWTIHEVTPVTAGTRYTLVGWCHGPRFR